MTLTHYGIREWGGSGIIALILEAGAFWLLNNGCFGLGLGLMIFIALIWLALAAFFRSPRRKIPNGSNLILGPADGTVRDIEVVDFDMPPFDAQGGKALRIGMFLSVFNVHVNRAPADMKVMDKRYREGRYLDARNSNCAKENEAMTISGAGSIDGVKFPVAVRQISGAIARRIVCPVEPGRELKKGEIYGMIKFGSRAEIYLPDDGSFEIKVKIGDKVRSGTTVVAVKK